MQEVFGFLRFLGVLPAAPRKVFPEKWPIRSTRPEVTLHQRSQTRAVEPSDLGIQAHCRRTAAIANLMAHHLFLPSEQKVLLRDACLLHHWDAGLLAPKSMEWLLADLGFKAAPGVVADPIPITVRGILNAYKVPGSGDPIELKIAGILRLAEAFDQSMEAQAIEGGGVDEILERLRCGVPAGLWPEDAMNALAESTRPAPIARPESWNIPIFPQAAMRMLSLMRDPLVDISRVVKAASLDPATAGLVMQLANSALFGSRGRLSTLSQAIMRLGFATTYKVVTTAALRPTFGSPKLAGLWPHSLEVADLSQQLACQTGRVDPAEAYLAGLVHDVGRMALLSAPLYDSARLEGLAGSGCPELYAEELLLRTNHAELGAQITAQWRLPEAMTCAIRLHHHPEKAETPLAHLLYLAEYLSGAEEDLPSILRLNVAMGGTGLQWEDIRDCRVSPLGSWLAAA